MPVGPLSELLSSPLRALRVLRVTPLLRVLCVASASSAFFLTPGQRADNPPAARAAIEEVLASMERSVLAADAEAYMRHVLAEDARFHQEQRNWAAELKKHRPPSFDLSIGPSRAGFTEAFEGDEARFELAMAYRMQSGHAATLPLGARASWPAVFVHRDPDGEGPESARWLYAGEQWSEQGAPGFVVKYFAGAEDTVRDVIEAFPVARAHVNEGFGIDLDEPQIIKLYDDMEHLKATVYLSMPDTVLGGWNEPGESIKFLTRYARDVRGWTRAFAHEYSHVATWEMGPRIKDAPWWVHEGVAELAAEQFDIGGNRSNDHLIRGMAGQGKLAAWDAIADYQTAAADVKMMAYHQGHHLMGYVSARWGRDSRNAWLRRLGQGASVDEATQAELGLSFAELDAAWRESLAKEPSK